MKPFLARYSSQGYALMRIVVGFLFLWFPLFANANKTL